jgi:hypothetical protein
MMRSVEPLGKDRCAVENVMGLSLSGVQSGSTARGKLACHFGDKLIRDGKLIGKWESHPPLWEWKC